MASFQQVFLFQAQTCPGVPCGNKLFLLHGHAKGIQYFLKKKESACQNTPSYQSVSTGDLGALRSSSPACFHLLLRQCCRVCEQGHLAGSHLGIQGGVRANERLHQLRGGPHLLLRRAEERDAAFKTSTHFYLRTATQSSGEYWKREYWTEEIET